LAGRGMVELRLVDWGADGGRGWLGRGRAVAVAGVLGVTIIAQPSIIFNYFIKSCLIFNYIILLIFCIYLFYLSP